MTSTMKKDISMQEQSSRLEPPPPPYNANSESDLSDYSTEDDEPLDRSHAGIPHDPASQGRLPLPVVIPQTTKVWKGAFASPFVRAWAPELEAHGLQKEDFVTLIDGLNECFVPHPVFTSLGVAGGIMSAVQGVQPVQLAGIGLQVASTAASGATSYIRTRQYVKAINESYFHPAGLHLHVFDTKKMTAKVNYPQEKLELPPLDYDTDLHPPTDGIDRRDSTQQTAAQLMEQNDPRLRRIKALEGYVLPIDLNVPSPTTPDNLLKKMSATKAAKLERKQNRKMQKKHAKLLRKKERSEGKSSKREAKLERLESRLEVTELELEKQKSGESVGAAKSMSELERERAKLSRKVDKKNAKMEKRALKAETKQPKRERKVEKRQDKLERKESKTANKIRWIVIVRRDQEEDSDQDSMPESEDEN